MEFESWYEILNDLAGLHGESVADKEAWREDYDQGKSAEAAFYDEFPQHEE